LLDRTDQPNPQILRISHDPSPSARQKNQLLRTFCESLPIHSNREPL
jgi:hypothetical protein